MKETYKGNASAPVLVAVIIVLAALIAFISIKHSKINDRSQMMDEVHPSSSLSSATTTADTKASTPSDLQAARAEILGTWQGDGFTVRFADDGTYVIDGESSSYGTGGVWKLMASLHDETKANMVERNLPDGLYLKIATQSKTFDPGMPTQMSPSYYVVGTINARTMIYVNATGKESNLVTLHRI